MKIPKKIQNLLDRRSRLAVDLMDVSAQLDTWLKTTVQILEMKNFVIAHLQDV